MVDATVGRTRSSDIFEIFDIFSSLVRETSKPHHNYSGKHGYMTENIFMHFLINSIVAYCSIFMHFN